MRLLSSPSYLRSTYAYIILSFFFVYLLLIQYCRTHYYRDPTSAFFDPDRGYEKIYSKFRLTQSFNYIHQVDATAHPANKTVLPTKSSASLCVGIPSISRDEINYVESAVGSLLLDLTEEERADIHLILFIPHTDPSVHPIYSSNWTSAVADTVLLYDLPQNQMDHVKNLELGHTSAAEKGLFDYTYLLKACHSAGTPYVVILEDDVIALDGWYHRTRHALDDADRKTSDAGASKYLYLRLFYTHKFLGWNSEEWFKYLSLSLLTVATVASTLLCTRRYLPQTSRLLPSGIIAVLCLIFTPLCIILFFSAGRVSMLPITAGVHQMPRFGCCSQALAFPRDRVTDLIEWFEDQKVGNADSLIEEFADANNEIRWALTPSLFQHVGILSSKFAGAGTRRQAKSIWNFEFERNNPITLALEHERAVGEVSDEGDTLR
ncbi:integral membrane protein [Aspergillus avenaceus]|uniref:Integral membrane protein n=1 Tax=Aspergillus avenaceus TaxID=36643 RepID=A0A5N6TXU8_ASPAV|nr:integral membrane protein [Aspergillus avenaceus]